MDNSALLLGLDGLVELADLGRFVAIGSGIWLIPIGHLGIYVHHPSILLGSRVIAPCNGYWLTWWDCAVCLPGQTLVGSTTSYWLNSSWLVRQASSQAGIGHHASCFMLGAASV